MATGVIRCGETAERTLGISVEGRLRKGHCIDQVKEESAERPLERSDEGRYCIKATR